MQQYEEFIRILEELANFDTEFIALQHSLERAVATLFRLEFPDITQQLFDIDKAEMSLREYVNTVLDILSEIPGVEDPIELAMSLGLRIDEGAIRRQLEQTLPNFVNDLINNLSLPELDFVVNMDYESVERLNAVLTQFGGVTEDTIQYIKQLHEAQNMLANSDFQRALEDLSDTLGDIQSVYSSLTSAKNEYNESGELSLDTLMRLLSMGDEYLSLLQYTENGIILNTDAIDDKTNALRDEIVASTKAALAEEIRAIIIRDIAGAYGEASTASDIMINRMAAVGEQALESAEDLGTLAAAAIVANQAMEGSIDVEGLSAGAIGDIENAIRNAQNRLNLIAATGSGRSGLGGRTSSGSRGGGGGGSSRTVEPYQAEIDATILLDARLTRIGELLTRNNALFDETSNVDLQSEILQDRIDLLREQQSLLHDINNINRGEMAGSIARFEEHGIRVSFVPELNKLEFEQTVDEIQAIINNISVGNPEQTNAVRREMESMLSSMISMNEANDRNSTQWQNIERSIRQTNMEMLNLDFNNFMEEANRELEVLNWL